MPEFRDATGEDASLISHIYATSWRKAYRGIIAQHYLDRLPDEYWVPAIRSWLDSGRLNGLIVYDDRRPVGGAIFGRGRDEDHDSWGEVVSFYMLPDVTRRGLGGALLDEVLARLRADGYSRVYLWAIEGNVSADSFYRKHGFHVTGDHVCYQIGGEPVRDLRYVRVTDSPDRHG